MLNASKQCHCLFEVSTTVPQTLNHVLNVVSGHIRPDAGDGRLGAAIVVQLDQFTGLGAAIVDQLDQFTGHGIASNGTHQDSVCCCRSLIQTTGCIHSIFKCLVGNTAIDETTGLRIFHRSGQHLRSFGIIADGNMQSLCNRADHILQDFLTDVTGCRRIAEITNRFIERCTIQGETVVEVITATLVGVRQLQPAISITRHDLLDRIQQVLVDVCTQITRSRTEVVAVCFTYGRGEIIIVHAVEEIGQIGIIDALDGFFITIGNFAGSGIFTVRVGNLVNHFIRTHRSHHDDRITHDTHEGVLECK